MWKLRLRFSAPIFQRALRVLLAGAVLAAPASVFAADAPQHIVSINLCTDQVVLALDPGDRVAAVSYLARDPDLSTFWREAQNIAVTQASLEGIMTLKPDLVIAGAFGHSRLLGHVERLGVEVLRVRDASSLADIRQTYLDVGKRLGLADRAAELVAEFDQVLGYQATLQERDAWILSPGLLVHADGMLGSSVLRHAGLTNAPATQTYVSLETLATHPPDLLLISEREEAAPSRAGKLFSHPALQRATDIMRVPPSALICGTVETAQLAARLAGQDTPGAGN